MFTGIVEELGVVEALEDQGDAVRLTVRGPHVTQDARLGDSVAVNGCCLTVADREGETFTADVMRETLDKTSLGALQPGGRVNLERAVTATSRLGGHIVQGHVDGTGSVVRREASEHWPARFVAESDVVELNVTAHRLGRDDSRLVGDFRRRVQHFEHPVDASALRLQGGVRAGKCLHLSLQ